MAAPAPEMNDRAASRRQTWLGIVGAALVALLIMANVLLLQIADRDTVGSKSSGAGAGGGQALLPQPSQGTSNRAATAEIDRLTKALDRRFKALQSQLAPLTGGVSAIGALVPLAGLAGQAGTDLRRVADSTVSLGAVRPGIDATNAQLGAVVRRLTSVDRSIGGVNGNTASVSATVAQTNRTIAGLRSDFQTLNREFAVYFQAFCSSQEPKKPQGCP
jgi:hypothetical protein